MVKAMQTKGIPYLDRLNTPHDIVEHLTMATKLFGNIFVGSRRSLSAWRSLGNWKRQGTSLNL